jgi:hypothetical protein
MMARAVANAPASLRPLDAASAGLRVAAEVLDQRRQFARQRQAIIAANAELRERELIKLASLAAALADALRRRGVGGPAASLTGEITVGVFKIAFECWVDAANQRALAELIRELIAQLVTLSAEAIVAREEASEAR